MKEIMAGGNVFKLNVQRRTFKFSRAFNDDYAPLYTTFFYFKLLFFLIK